MNRFRRINGVVAVLSIGLRWSVACDFGGDRSLGTVARGDQPTGGTTGAGGTTDAGGSVPTGGSQTSDATTSSQAGGSSASSTTSVIPMGTVCHPDAQPSECPSNQYCALDAHCDRDASSVGSCHDRPPSCEQPNGNEDVCGCDGSLHDSRCVAERDGITVTNVDFCKIPCLDVVDCRKLDRYCLDSYGAEAKGATCDASLQICKCGGTISIL